MLKTEESMERKPDFGMTRGKTIFRFNHQEVERQNDAGDETSWTCNYVLTADRARSTLIDAIISAQYSRADELSLINNKDLNETYAAEYKEYQAFRVNAKTIVDAAL